MKTIQITLNGESTEVPAEITVAGLLGRLDLRSEQVAVERNRRIVRRTEHATVELRNGDALEVVTLVGGG